MTDDLTATENARDIALRHGREMGEDRDRWMEDAERLADALRSLQWSYADDIGGYDLCPECFGYESHGPKCGVGSALHAHDALLEGIEPQGEGMTDERQRRIAEAAAALLDLLDEALEKGDRLPS